MYFTKVVREACRNGAGCVVIYRTKTGYQGEGIVDGFGEDGMRLRVHGFSGDIFHKFVRFESLEEILFEEAIDEGEDHPE